MDLEKMFVCVFPEILNGCTREKRKNIFFFNKSKSPSFYHLYCKQKSAKISDQLAKACWRKQTKNKYQYNNSILFERFWTKKMLNFYFYFLSGTISASRGTRRPQNNKNAIQCDFEEGNDCLLISKRTALWTSVGYISTDPQIPLRAHLPKY